jgi:hypothetical protein
MKQYNFGYDYDYNVLKEFFVKHNYNMQIDYFLKLYNIQKSDFKFKKLSPHIQFDMMNFLYQGYDYKIIKLIAQLYKYNIDNEEFIKIFISNWLYITVHIDILRYIKQPSYELCEWLLIKNINYYKHIIIPNYDYELQKQVKELYKFLTL